MHVSRGGWLGQTYALAKFDDSYEGKKSGTRRSKEERKGMVETFIKRYQKSNNGDFPSLNLTRKEVGGSFYTVREIVREIIQENRVLGPPKSTSPSEDQNIENLDSFLEHNPLGSMSVDLLHVHVASPIDTQTLEEGIVGQKDEINGLVTNQTQNEIVLEDVNTIHTTDEKSNEREVVDVDIEEKDSDSENGDLAADVEEETPHPVLQSTPTLASHKSQNIEDSLPAVEITINGAIRNAHTLKSTLDETNTHLNKSSDQNPNSISQKRRTTATLNRINLESWEAASRKSTRPETHRLVTFIKSFVTAFVKFWTE